MSREVAALALIVLVHFIGLGALIFTLLRGDDQRADWRGWWPRNDDGPERPAPGHGPTGDHLPLPDAQPSRVRLRDDRRIADGHPGPARRPDHPPQRTPERAPADID